jgi:hypothetical protein
MSCEAYLVKRAMCSVSWVLNAVIWAWLRAK